MHWGAARYSVDATFLENNNARVNGYNCRFVKNSNACNGEPFPPHSPQACLVPPSSQRCSQDSFRATWCSAATLAHVRFDMLSFYFFQCLLPWGQGCFMFFISKLCASRPGI